MKGSQNRENQKLPSQSGHDFQKFRLKFVENQPKLGKNWTKFGENWPKFRKRSLKGSRKYENFVSQRIDFRFSARTYPSPLKPSTPRVKKYQIKIHLKTDFNCLHFLVFFSLDTFEPYGMKSESISLYSSEDSSSYVPPSPYMSEGNQIIMFYFKSHCVVFFHLSMRERMKLLFHSLDLGNLGWKTLCLHFF